MAFVPNNENNDLTADEYMQSFAICGLPFGGVANVVTGMTHLPPSLSQAWSPTYTVGNFGDLVALLIVTLVDLDQAVVDRLRTQCFQYWDEIEVSEIQVSQSDGDVGVLLNDSVRKEKIREMFCEATGYAVPYGGYYRDSKRAYSIVRDHYGCGDR